MLESYRGNFKKIRSRLGVENKMRDTYIIFSDNNEKANNKMQTLLEKIPIEKVKAIIKTKEGIREIKLIDGVRYCWLKPSLNCKGVKCTYAYIDKDLSQEILETIIYPIAFCCKKERTELF